MGSELNTELARAALRRAVALRGAEPRLLFHSDRGGEFTSNAFSADLAAVGALRSLSRTAECHDNAPMESFFGTLKDELDVDHGRAFASPEHARTVIGEYIECFYNRVRRHSAKEYLSPVDFEVKSTEVDRSA